MTFKNKEKTMNKSILAEAIRKLETLNLQLTEKIHTTKDKNLIDTYSKQISKNQSMILDYKFRMSENG